MIENREEQTMKWKRVWIVVVMMILIILAGCTRQGLGDPTATKNDEQIIGMYSEALDELMPQMPTSWIYSGTAEYNHVMSIGEIYETMGQKIYRIYGEVEDMTGGNSGADFRFELAYSVLGDSIVQSKKGQMLMDSDYDKIILIKLPLEIGNTWSENIIDNEGNSVKITSVIEDISEDEGTIYTVRYSAKGSEYYEVREIKEGSGVVHFEKVLFYDGDMFPVQYSLFKLNREETLIVKEEKDNESVKDLGPFGDATTIELDTIPQLSEGNVPNEDDLVALNDLIMEFNGAWVKFANDKDMGILEFVTNDGDAYEIIQKFPAGTMTLSFELIDIGDIKVEGNRANLHVHEIIKKVVPEKTEMLEYFWLYEARKIGDQWVVHSYVSDAKNGGE